MSCISEYYFPKWLKSVFKLFVLVSSDTSINKNVNLSQNIPSFSCSLFRKLGSASSQLWFKSSRKGEALRDVAWRRGRKIDYVTLGPVSTSAKHGARGRSCSSLNIVVFSMFQYQSNMDTSRAGEKQKSSCRQRAGHTPLCLDTCNLEHNDVVVALCLDGRHVRGRIHCVGVLPIALMEGIEYLKLQGWHIDSEIPDSLEELRCPLLYLACAFGKIGIVEGLLRHNFNPRVVNRHGETALHGAVKHLYNAVPYARQRKSVEPGTNVSIQQRREEAFLRILSLLTEYYPRILAFKENSGFTALYLSATMITRRNCNEHYRRCTKLNKRASFQKFCLKLMIKRLFELEAVSLLTKNEVMDIITTSDNADGESLLHILARDSKGGFEVLKFIHGLLLSLGTELPNAKSRRLNETVFSIAWQTDARGAAEIFPGLSQQQPCQGESCSINRPSSACMTTQLKWFHTPGASFNYAFFSL